MKNKRIVIIIIFIIFLIVTSVASVLVIKTKKANNETNITNNIAKEEKKELNTEDILKKRFMKTYDFVEEEIKQYNENVYQPFEDSEDEYIVENPSEGEILLLYSKSQEKYVYVYYYGKKGDTMVSWLDLELLPDMPNNPKILNVTSRSKLIYDETAKIKEYDEYSSIIYDIVNDLDSWNEEYVFRKYNWKIQKDNLVLELSNEYKQEDMTYYSLYDADKNKWSVINNKNKEYNDIFYDEMIAIPNKHKPVFIVTYDIDYANETYHTKAINKKNEVLFSEYDEVAAIERTEKNKEKQSISFIKSNESIEEHFSGEVSYNSEVLKIKKNGKFGLIDFDGKLLLEAEYEEIKADSDDEEKLLLKKDGKTIYYNCKLRKCE